MKVLWLTNLPSPYRVKFFNELGKMCDLTVLFETRVSKERDESWSHFTTDSFNAIFLKGKKIGASNAFCPGVLKYLKRNYDHIIVTDFSSPTGILAIIFLKIMNISYEIESDGGFPGRGRGIKEKFKSFILKGADCYFSTATSHDQYYMKYGVDKKKIVRYPFTSISCNDIIKEPVNQDEKSIIRLKLGIKEDKVVLSVGQFIYRKGFDILIASYDRLPNNVGIYIVGGQPTHEYLKMAEGKERIHFVGYKLKEELKEYYKASDVFAFPTREDIWGLVVNEAMAFGLPVVTTKKCVAGLEMVIDGENGLLINVDDKDSLSDAIVKVIENNKNGELSRNSIKMVTQYTIESMANCHIQYFISEKYI